MGKVLTVSVAAYNVENYLEECLNSFIKADVLEDCEVIIVNDGSTDNTSHIAEKYQRDYPDTFIHINKENSGWGSTLNCAINKGSGKYFKQLDGDDYYNHKELKNFVDLLKIVDADIVYTQYSTFEDATGKILDNFIAEEFIDRNSEYKIADFNIPFRLAMHNCTVKTNVLKDNNIVITEKCFYTDVEYVLKSLNCSKTILFSDINIYRYRISRDGQSVSDEGYRKHYKEHLKVINNLLEYKNNNKIYNRSIFDYNFCDMLMNQYRIFLKLTPSSEHYDEFKTYDSIMKKEYPLIYKKVRKKIKIIRILGLLGYKFIFSMG